MHSDLDQIRKPQVRLHLVSVSKPDLDEINLIHGRETATISKFIAQTF